MLYHQGLSFGIFLVHLPLIPDVGTVAMEPLLDRLSRFAVIPDFLALRTVNQVNHVHANACTAHAVPNLEAGSCSCAGESVPLH